MKKILLAGIVIFFLSNDVRAQEALEDCRILIDNVTYNEVTNELALKWADGKPICVKCENNIVYPVNKLNFRIILQDPFRNKDFGTTEGGIPLLGRKLLQEAKDGDTVLLGDPTYIDDNGREMKLPNIVFKIVSKIQEQQIQSELDE